MTTITTQVKRPGHATIRTVFQALIGFCVMWPIIVDALDVDTKWVWVSVSLAITAGVTRVMAIPAVESWLQRYLPWLSADPSPET